MNAVELSGELDDGTHIFVFACSTCHLAYDKAIKANECCQPRVCEDCDKVLTENRIKCHECQAKDWAGKLERMWEKAKKVEWAADTGPVYCECCEKFYTDSDTFIDGHNDRMPLPKYVWGCERHVMALDAYEITDDAWQGYPEHSRLNADSKELKLLQKYLDTWCEYADIAGYYPDTNTAVIVPAIEPEE